MMPCTIKHETPYLALVVFEDGSALSHSTRNEVDAYKYISQKLHSFGTHIVATDVIPNVIEIG